jgi:penicillin-binding protein 2
MLQLPNDKNRRWKSKVKEPKPESTSRGRFIFLKVTAVLLFGALTLQLARMQIVDHDEYHTRAEVNRLRVVPELPARGLIYDRHGELLVTNRPILSAGVVPADVTDEKLEAVVSELARISGTAKQTIVGEIRKAQASNDPYTPVIVKQDIDRETAFLLRERQPGLPGVQIVVESVRIYPKGALASHYLGYVGRIDAEEYAALRSQGYLLNDRLGKAGVELTYESALRGTAGYRQVEIDAAGREVQVIDEASPTAAGNLVLSLDLDLQRESTEILQRAMTGGSKNAAAIVMDVRTGELLSMVTLPTYDNNILTDPPKQARMQPLLNDPAKPLVNHAISEVYPPGSTFKEVTGTAALQEGVATTSTTIFSGGSITIPNEYGGPPTVMKDWAAHGSMDFYRGLAVSSDVYFYYLAGGFGDFQGLGATRLARYARDYGFGAPTGIDIPGEASGNVPDPTWKEDAIGEPWVLGDTYNFGIGQGYLTVTPMQLIRVTAAIANGGNLLTPHVAKEIVDDQGKVLRRVEPESRKVSVSTANLEIMREAMRQAVVYGPAQTGASSQVSIGAKTGTAEFGQQSADGTYALSHGWYTGFAPYDNPEIAIVVFLEKGVGATHGGPVAKQIFDYYFARQRLAEGAPAQ